MGPSIKDVRTKVPFLHPLPLPAFVHFWHTPPCPPIGRRKENFIEIAVYLDVYLDVSQAH